MPSMRRTLAAAACTAVLIAGAAEAATFRNPLNTSDGSDPWMTYYNGNYYVTTTTWSNIRIKRASTIAGLKTATATTVWSDSTASRCCNVWAPEFHSFNGRWYLYYTAGWSQNLDNQRTHVLESAGADPLGPYSYKARVFAPNADGWAIDGSVLSLNGALYFLFSSWEGDEQCLFIAPMSNPWTVSGNRVRISRPSNTWERALANVNEGPEVLQRNGQTFIVYSASACWGPGYALGMLTYNGGNVLAASSWTKSGPVFQSANGAFGPAHNGFFKSPNGVEDWIVYHANSSAAGGCDGGRTTRVQRFVWNSNGTPSFGAPLATSADVTAPAGEGGPTPTPTPPPTGVLRIVNRNSGKCLDLSGRSSADGGNVIQWACTGATNQQWRVEATSGGYSRIVNVNSGKVLDVANCATADGANVQQWAWLNNNCQQWRTLATDAGFVRIENRNSAKVLDVANCGTADGTNVQQWAWLGNNCQQWQLQP